MGEADFGQNGSQKQLGLVLGSGGARAAYQAGVLQYMHELIEDLSFPIITGVSAGAINATFLACYPGLRGANALMQCWRQIDQDKVFHAETSMSLIRRLLPGFPLRDPVIRVKEGEAILNTEPLRRYLSSTLHASPDGSLPQIQRNMDHGRLAAVCVTTTNFTTGQSVSWVQGCGFQDWERPNRISYQDDVSIDHVLASGSLPLLFPAVKLRGSWHGDGGMRLIAPLSPSIHLGATDIICISPKYSRTMSEASQPLIAGYPPAAQVLGIMLNATFLDAFDHDIQMANRITKLVRHMPKSYRDGIRPLNILLLQPSVDLAKLAHGFELKTKGVLRMLTRGLGSTETLSPDWFSVILFDPQFIGQVLELGYEDARNHSDIIKTFFERGTDA